MDERDLLDEIIFYNDNMKSLLEILNNIIVKFDENTMNSRDRNKILKVIGQFSVIVDALVEKNNLIYKKCDVLCDKVVELESMNKTTQNIKLEQVEK